MICSSHGSSQMELLWGFICNTFGDFQISYAIESKQWFSEGENHLLTFFWWMYLLSSGHFISSIKVWLYFIMRWEKNVLEKDSLKTSPYAQLLSSTEFRILGLLICFCLNSSLPCSSPLGMDIYVLHECEISIKL